MSSGHTLSVRAAIFITLNIMLGTGVFINTAVLAQKAGAWSVLLYLMGGVLMLPLIMSFARLTQVHEGADFYSFGASINPYVGFINTWGYFMSKLSSASLSLFVFSSFVQKTIPSLATIPTLALALSVLTIFSALNLLGTRIGSIIQTMFLTTKLFPLLGTILLACTYFEPFTIPHVHEFLPQLPITLPLVLFCFLGFEATCSLSRIIENPRKNASRVILFSFTILLTLTTLYQLFFYGALGDTLTAQTHNLSVSVFQLLVEKTMPTAAAFLPKLFSLAVATSAMGGAYGILYSNMWNLYSLADQGHLPYSTLLTRFNRYHIPFMCVAAEALACCIYLFSTQGSQIPLQYISTLGCLITYTVGILSLFKLTYSPLSVAGLMSCSIALWICIKGFIATSLTPLFGFGLILFVGTLLFKPRTKILIH